MKKIFLIIIVIHLTHVEAAPNWDTLRLSGGLWIAQDDTIENLTYYCPQALTTGQPFHFVDEDINKSIYKYVIVGQITPQQKEHLVHQFGEHTRLQPFGVRSLKIEIYTKKSGEVFDFPFALEKNYFEGDLTHWALPSHVILKVPNEWEPSFGRFLSARKYLPYQYSVTVGTDVQEGHYIDVTLPLLILQEEKQ